MLRAYTVADTHASYAGEKGGIAWLLDASDGHPLQELRFVAAPVWDGIAIAHGSYFVCLKDGSVVSLSAESSRPAPDSCQIQDTKNGEQS